jgi:hypothetical protein
MQTHINQLFIIEFEQNVRQLIEFVTDSLTFDDNVSFRSQKNDFSERRINRVLEN